ncbi:MAG: hypothetical protein LKF00_09130 [Olsenella sp.]|jgi:hypothetical protein|nr:hypothetical protein [Olsenella sp.]MCI1289510.1 hypothetical protein [Olsenella sp.]
MLHWARLFGDQYLGLWTPGILLMVFVVRGDATPFSASDAWEKACLAHVWGNLSGKA